MFQRRSSLPKPTIKNCCHSSQVRIESNHHGLIKLFLSALIPLMIGIFTVVITILQQKLSIEQREQDKQDAFLLRQQSERQADNLQKETIFATYLDDVSKLLLLEDQTKSLVHIRSKTLMTLRQLDPERKKHLLWFLYESELIFRNPEKSISTFLKVSDADFNGIYLKGTIENKCALVRLYLYGAYLSNTSFIDCYIDGLNLSSSIMYKTLFVNTLVTRTSFKFAFMDKTNFSSTKFFDVNFFGASLVDCDFTSSVWEKGSVDFTNTNLSGAIISNEQLDNSTWFNCVLPNGTWGSINTDNLVVNGDGKQNCTTNGSTILNGWTVATDGNIKLFAFNNQNGTENFGKCYFRVTSFYTSKKIAFIYQFIDLGNFSLLISTSTARYNASVNCQCFGNQYATIELRFIDLNGLRSNGVSKGTGGGTNIQSLKLSDIVRSDVRRVQILVTFKTTESSDDSNATIDKHYCICDNVKFIIMKS